MDSADRCNGKLFQWKGAGGSNRDGGGGDSVGKMPVKQPEFRLKYICKKGGHGDTGLSF